MALDLVDFRMKNTPEANAVLEAKNRATGRDKSEIAREVLHKWALEEIEAASLIVRLLKAEGLSGDDEGGRAK